jgi:hypothetical protein
LLNGLSCRTANIPIAIPQCFYERGDGLGVADFAQRLRCRTANIIPIIPQCFYERGDGLGVAEIAQRPRCRKANSTVAIPQRLDERGHGGCAQPHHDLAHLCAGQCTD